MTDDPATTARALIARAIGHAEAGRHTLAVSHLRSARLWAAKLGPEFATECETAIAESDALQDALANPGPTPGRTF